MKPEIKTSWEIACEYIITYEEANYVINPEIPHKKWVSVDDFKEALKDLCNRMNLDTERVDCDIRIHIHDFESMAKEIFGEEMLK